MRIQLFLGLVASLLVQTAAYAGAGNKDGTPDASACSNHKAGDRFIQTYRNSVKTTCPGVDCKNHAKDAIAEMNYQVVCTIQCGSRIFGLFPYVESYCCVPSANGTQCGPQKSFRCKGCRGEVNGVSIVPTLTRVDNKVGAPKCKGRTIKTSSAALNSVNSSSTPQYVDVDLSPSDPRARDILESDKFQSMQKAVEQSAQADSVLSADDFLGYDSSDPSTNQVDQCSLEDERIQESSGSIQ